MSATLLVKGLKFAAALGVTKVCTDFLKANTVTETFVQKALVNAGGLVLGSMIMDHATRHVNDTLKTIAEQIKEAKEEAEEDKPEDVVVEKEGP